MAADNKQTRQERPENEGLFGTKRGSGEDDHASGDYWEEVGDEMTSGGEVDVERSSPSRARGSGQTTSGIEGEVTAGITDPEGAENGGEEGRDREATK